MRTSPEVRSIVVSNPGPDPIYNLDVSISGLSAQRRGLLTAAHELTHHVLTGNGTNDTGMSAVFAAFELIASYYPSKPPPAFASSSPAAPGTAQWTPPAWMSMLLHDFGYDSPDCAGVNSVGMPSWTTTDFLGMLPWAWLHSDDAGTPSPEHDRLSVVSRLLDGAVRLSSPSASVRASLLRLIDALLALARLCLIQLMTLVREQQPALACVRLPLGVSAFFRAVLAACRRYGRRSEPDDHVSLCTRQTLVSMGSCALAC